MAANETPETVSNTLETSDKDEKDENSFTGASTSVFSSEFDPLSAIYAASSSSVPDKSAKIHDNVEKFVSVMEQRNKPKKPEKDLESVICEPLVLKRQFTFVPSVVPRKKMSNLWTVMEKMGKKKGPMSLLHRAYAEQIKIKVYIRGFNYIRGTAEGFLAAFDKHWNLALTDVDEVFKRRRFGKSPPMSEEDALSQRIRELDLETKEKTEKVGNSVCRVVKTNRKWEFCERHSVQLLLRGEHVSHVCIVDF